MTRPNQEDIDHTYRVSVKKLRRLVEIDGMDLEHALTSVITIPGLGLCQIAQIEREARDHYGTEAAL